LSLLFRSAVADKEIVSLVVRFDMGTEVSESTHRSFAL
jgi:hypothetical protein